MARSFGDYSPVVPLDTTWEESIALTDQNGAPINLTGYAARAQLRSVLPVSVAGIPTTTPLLELTTTAYYGTLPAWPVYAGLSIPTPANGVILLAVPSASYSAVVSPTNAKVKLYWDVKLVNQSTGYTIPVVAGKTTFLPAVTI